MRSKEYNEGYDAYWKFARTNDNPYERDTIQHKDWREGFEIALLEDADAYNAYYGE